MLVGKYAYAVEYKGKRRNILPAVYNPRRLLEQPIPSIMPIVPSGSETDILHEGNNVSIEIKINYYY